MDIPDCLHGKKGPTKTAWRKIVETAWEDGAWDRAFAELKFSSFDLQPADIVLREVPRAFGNADRWWLCWVKEVLQDACVSDPDYEKHHLLVLSGMKHCWFTIGMLGLEDDVTCNFTAPRGRLIETIYRPALERFVHRLPEIIDLSPYFAYGLPADSEIQPPVLQNAWIGRIIALCNCVGKPVEFVEVEHEFAGDVVAALIAKEIIEESDDRFRLRV